jgi:hypothetical protein
LFVLLSALFVLLTAGCPQQAAAPTPDASDMPTSGASGQVTVSLTFNHRSGIASNQFAVWIEDSEGTFIKTLYATRFTAQGGWKSRPDALPVWVERSGLSAGTAQPVDTYTGATPKTGSLSYTWDCTDQNGKPVPAGEYTFFVEGSIFWKDAVLFSGVIDISGEENSAEAKAEYTTEAAKKTDMISGVTAVYKPQ